MANRIGRLRKTPASLYTHTIRYCSLGCKGHRTQRIIDAGEPSVGDPTPG